MDVYAAVASRRAVRAFAGRPVAVEVLHRVLAAAGRAPSGANLQPWRSYLLTGATLAELTRRTGGRAAAGDQGDERQFPMYPEDLAEPYRRRRAAAAAQRFAALGIDRADRAGRQRAVTRNWDCFGAPALLLCYLDPEMGPPQWADAGMHLATVMLLLRAEGLHSCPQLAWSVYHRTVAEVVGPPLGAVLFCGLAIGHADPAAPGPRITRAPLTETTTFLN